MTEQRIYRSDYERTKIAQIPKETFKFKTVEISGFGVDTSYELGCQRMLYLGIKWLKGKPLRVFDGMHGYAGIIGVENTEKSQLGELEEIWNKDPFLNKGGMTGAMHQFVLHRLKYIHEEGFEAWMAAASHGHPDDVIKVDMWD